MPDRYFSILTLLDVARLTPTVTAPPYTKASEFCWKSYVLNGKAKRGIVCLDPFATLFPESLVPGSICNAKTYLPRTCSANAGLLPKCCKLLLPNHDGGGESPPILTLRLLVLVETPISPHVSSLFLGTVALICSRT